MAEKSDAKLRVHASTVSLRHHALFWKALWTASLHQRVRHGRVAMADRPMSQQLLCGNPERQGRKRQSWARLSRDHAPSAMGRGRAAHSTVP